MTIYRSLKVLPSVCVLVMAALAASQDQPTNSSPLYNSSYFPPPPEVSGLLNSHVLGLMSLGDTPTKAAVLQALNRVETRLDLFKADGNGNMSIIFGSITSANTYYEAAFSWKQFQVVRLGEFEVEYGYAFQMRARIRTTSRGGGLNLANFLGLAAAVEQKQANGYLQMELLGVEGQGVVDSFDIPAKLTPETIEKCLTEFVKIKSKVYSDEKISVTPQLLAWRRVGS